MELLSYIQIILAVLLVAAILMQQTDASLGAVFGGGQEDTGGGSGHTRRGMEKVIFNATIVLAVLFSLSILWVFIV